jgi:membrane-associated protease RseP (regulator of RpoE activity)
MKCRAIITLLLLAAFTGSARAGDPPFKVPFDTLQTKHIVVMVKINGKGPYRLIFDTGAPMTLINNKIARDSGVLPKDSKPVFPFFLGQVPDHKMETLEIGNVKAMNLTAVIMDHPTVAAIDRFLGPVEGIVGLTFFARYRMTIDYQAKEMTFVPVDYTPPEVMKGMLATLFDTPKPQKLLAPKGQWGFSVTKDAKDEEAGVTINQVLPDSPAAVAGLKVGDRLLTLDGRWTDTVADCYRAASFVRTGTSARVVVVRDGKEVELTVKVSHVDCLPRTPKGYDLKAQGRAAHPG